MNSLCIRWIPFALPLQSRIFPGSTITVSEHVTHQVHILVIAPTSCHFAHSSSPLQKQRQVDQMLERSPASIKRSLPARNAGSSRAFRIKCLLTKLGVSSGDDHALMVPLNPASGFFEVESIFRCGASNSWQSQISRFCPICGSTVSSSLLFAPQTHTIEHLLVKLLHWSRLSVKALNI